MSIVRPVLTTESTAARFVASIAIGLCIVSCDPADPSIDSLSQQACCATSVTWPRPGLTESAASSNRRFPDVVVSVVTVEAPLPAAYPAHPASCDALRYLRFRHRRGPIDPSDAERILVAQPGILEGASAFLTLASNVVDRAATEHGAYVEFWAIDRRSNCLEDLNGLARARATGDAHDFVDYYYRGARHGRSRFAGFLDPRGDAAWLADLGMDQTIDDWNSVLVRSIPDPSVRRAKIFLGGHSLGGFITGAFASHDFDGNPATRSDAGFEQCAGYFALDTVVSNEPMVTALSGSAVDVSGLVGSIPERVVEAMREGRFARFVSVSGVIDPEIMNLLVGLGFAASVAPESTSDLVGYLPASDSVSHAMRFYHSRNLSDYLGAVPTIESIRYTNEAMLAVFTDDNAMPLSIVRTSTGFFTGGPVEPKAFPLPMSVAEALESIPALAPITAFVGSGRLAIAVDDGSLFRRAPVYRWLDFDEVDTATIPNAQDGLPYTNPSREVTRMGDLALALGAYPLDFVEKYFPTRLAVDSLLGGDPADYPDGTSRRPILTITAGDGPNLGAGVPIDHEVVAAGYDHLDVLTAAPEQNDGRPEIVATSLLEFVMSH